MTKVEKKSIPRGKGGARPGSGRKPGSPNKITLSLKERLAPLDDIGIRTLEEIAEKGTFRERIEAVRLSWEYRHGKPKQSMDLEVGGSFVLAVSGGGQCDTAAEWAQSYANATSSSDV